MEPVAIAAAATSKVSNLRLAKVRLDSGTLGILGTLKYLPTK